MTKTKTDRRSTQVDQQVDPEVLAFRQQFDGRSPLDEKGLGRCSGKPLTRTVPAIAKQNVRLLPPNRNPINVFGCLKESQFDRFMAIFIWNLDPYLHRMKFRVSRLVIGRVDYPYHLTGR